MIEVYEPHRVSDVVQTRRAVGLTMGSESGKVNPWCALGKINANAKVF
jgi:hypothetical protein